MKTNWMKTICMTLVACAAICWSSLEAATLHAVLVGDTTDSSLGYAFELDLGYMESEMRTVAKHTGMGLDLHVFSGDEVTPDHVLGCVKALKIDEDDTVVLYFGMHGYRTYDKDGNPWPNLHFGLMGKGVDFALFNQIVSDKSPRFILSIADSCNSYVPDGAIPTIMKAGFIKRAPVSKAQLQANYRQLFLESEGHIMVSGSHPGQYSWYLTQKGGYLTLKFLDSLRDMVKGTNPPSWSLLLQNASEKVEEEVTSFNEEQTPQYFLKVNN